MEKIIGWAVTMPTNKIRIHATRKNAQYLIQVGATNLRPVSDVIPECGGEVVGWAHEDECGDTYFVLAKEAFAADPRRNLRPVYAEAEADVISEATNDPVDTEDEEWANFDRTWGVSGMPADKIRLAQAAWAAALEAAKESVANVGAFEEYSGATLSGAVSRVNDLIIKTQQQQKK